MKKLLIVVDYQNDFVDGKMGFPGAEKLEPGILERMEEYRKNGDDVAFTYDTHGQDYLNTQEGRNLPIIHGIEGSEGYKLYGGLEAARRPEDRVFKKPTFGSAELLDYLRTKADVYDTIELCGVVSNMCVISNAIIAKAALPEALIVVDSKLTASFDPKMNEAALKVLGGIQVKVL